MPTKPTLRKKTYAYFFQGKEGPVTTFDGKLSFPSHEGAQPNVGEVWEVSVQNSTGRNNFLKLYRKVQPDWEWSNKLSGSSRKPACLLVSHLGGCFKFTGESIPGVTEVLTSKYTKAGRKWSHTTYYCSGNITNISWYEDRKGQFWPQASWEEALRWVHSKGGTQASLTSLKACLREFWPDEARKFDLNDQISSLIGQNPVGWEYCDKLHSHGSRPPTCVIVSAEGIPFLFKGKDIPKLLHVTSSQYEKSGKWSNTTYQLICPEGTTFRKWYRTSGKEFWPESSWQEAHATMLEHCPGIQFEAFKSFVRTEWPEESKKFDR